MPRRLAAAAVLLVLGAVGCADDVATRAASWTLVREAGRTLELEVVTGSSTCSTVHRTDIEQDVEHVRVVVQVRDDVGSGADCTSDEATETIDVILVEVRGDRPLSGCDPDDLDAVCEAADP